MLRSSSTRSLFPLLPHVALIATLAFGSSSCIALHRMEVKRRSEMAQIELERVAKDWSQTIRASQVIPIYPLSEDVQPGDVFLVTSTIEQQHEDYLERGYLPLTNHVARIDPDGYVPFYAQSFAAKDLPKSWLNVGQPSSFTSAPGAAFPTYSFSVKSGQAFSGALPIQGVPVGLSLLGASAATGSVTIADARTYGVDMISLHRQVEAWAARNATFLAAYASEEKAERYLRVVTRVYLTGRLEVSLNASSSSSAGLDVGAPKPAEIPALAVGSSDGPVVVPDNYEKALDGLNKGLAIDAAPGASLKVTAASGNSVSLSEKFPRPVVIGYLGFDVRIGAGGALGPPMPTHAVLESGARPGTSVAAVGPQSTQVANTYRVLVELARSEPGGSGEVNATVGELDEMAERLLPLRRPVPIVDSNLVVLFAEGTPIDRGNSAFRALISHLDGLRRSRANYLAKLNEDPALKDARAAELARVQAEIVAIEERLFVVHGPLLMKAEKLASRS